MTDKIRVKIQERYRIYAVPRSWCYACPEEVPEHASSVPVEAYPAGGVGPIRVRIAAPSRPRLARPRPEPEAGERVLLSITSWDMLSLFVGIVELEATR